MEVIELSGYTEERNSDCQETSLPQAICRAWAQDETNYFFRQRFRHRDLLNIPGGRTAKPGEGKSVRYAVKVARRIAKSEGSLTGITAESLRGI